MVNESQGSYFKLFRDMGFNVFLWNYRGYGFSTGKPTPANLKSDIDKVHDYLI
jgi:alpha/beta superfamily hydrolase